MYGVCLVNVNVSEFRTFAFTDSTFRNLKKKSKYSPPASTNRFQGVFHASNAAEKSRPGISFKALRFHQPEVPYFNRSFQAWRRKSWVEAVNRSCRMVGELRRCHDVVICHEEPNIALTWKLHHDNGPWYTYFLEADYLVNR